MITDEPRAKVQREPRRQLRMQPAWITVEDGTTKLECFIVDISPGGARIVTDAAIDVRDTFGLMLVPDHAKRQPCEVVWRRGRTYGVKFVRDAEQRPSVPACESETEQETADSLEFW